MITYNLRASHNTELIEGFTPKSIDTYIKQMGITVDHNVFASKFCLASNNITHNCRIRHGYSVFTNYGVVFVSINAGNDGVIYFANDNYFIPYNKIHAKSSQHIITLVGFIKNLECTISVFDKNIYSRSMNSLFSRIKARMNDRANHTAWTGIPNMIHHAVPDNSYRIFGNQLALDTDPAYIGNYHSLMNNYLKPHQIDNANSSILTELKIMLDRGYEFGRLHMSIQHQKDKYDNSANRGFDQELSHYRNRLGWYVISFSNTKILFGLTSIDSQANLYITRSMFSIPYNEIKGIRESKQPDQNGHILLIVSTDAFVYMFSAPLKWRSTLPVMRIDNYSQPLLHNRNYIEEHQSDHIKTFSHFAENMGGHDVSPEQCKAYFKTCSTKLRNYIIFNKH